MATYPSIDGVATHGSEKLLTQILREELGFEGLVLSEGAGINTLIGEHMASNQKDAGQLALRAGLDVAISLEPGYMHLLVESVKEGKASMADVDRAVKRILRQKFRLGLFENRYADPDRAARLVHSAENQQLALQAAREGIVLLKNVNGLLPLSKKIGTIAVIGPNADEVRNQLGDYTSKTITQDVVTILKGIRKKVTPETKVLHVKGCDILGTDPKGIAEAQEAAKQADVAIVVVGERQPHPDNPQLRPTNGEPHDMASLDLTGQQQELVEAVHATGKPTVVVLVNGRPLSIRWIADHVPAIVEAWSPGERGGDAVADVLFGDYNPSGRLAISVPRHSGQLPIYYNYKPSRERRRYVDMESAPLFHFGFGLSYTTFEYSNLQIAPKNIRPAEQVRVSVDVKNTGQRAGDEVVQLYIRDLISSVSRPVKELKGFEKISLKPGETRTVHFTLSPEELSFLNARLERVVEPGTFAVMVGSSVDRIRLNGNFEVAAGK
jgi:beta-glucosidase